MSEQRKRGFSSMDKAKQKEIASKGGKAAHEKGTAHEFTSDEARAAGRKGGASSKAKRQKPTAESENAAEQPSLTASQNGNVHTNGSAEDASEEQDPDSPRI